MKTVWIYVTDYGRIGDEDWVKVFSSSDAADEWLEQNDPAGVAWEYPIHDRVTGHCNETPRKGPPDTPACPASTATFRKRIRDGATLPAHRGPGK
jgi:hypothetical protein